MSASEQTPSEKDRPQSGDTGSSEQAAIEYLDAQLAKSRAALRITRIVSVVVALIVLGYFGFLTLYLHKQFLAPKAAAATANDFAVNLVLENGPELADKLRKEIPPWFRELPDRGIAQLPRVRELVEEELEKRFQEFCRDGAVEFGDHLDSFLEENKEALDSFLEAAQQPEGAKEIAEKLEEEIRLYLEEPGEDGESIQDKLDESLKGLRQIESRLGHLAANKDLTAHETQLRHAIAVIMHIVEKEVPKLVE